MNQKRPVVNAAVYSCLLSALILCTMLFCASAWAQDAPSPLLDTHTPVHWWFAFKFNSATFPNSCSTALRACPFGGTLQPDSHVSQEFAIASSSDPMLKAGGACVGGAATDPLGATFNEIYSGKLSYVVWNDDFGTDPLPLKGAGWGHSKGVLAWDQNGNGLVLQVSTPGWPGSGSSAFPRKIGNSLGCVLGDNNIEVSQHFFALKLTKDDVLAVLDAMRKARVPTDPTIKQIVKNGDPPEIRVLVQVLGKATKDAAVGKSKLSSGVVLISKPPGLHVPPWQLVSEELGGEPLRVATWWHSPQINTTTATTSMGCWDTALKKPGAVEIATSGTWEGKSIGLQGIAAPNGNHAKVGVSTGSHTYAIFGDMNQQGSLSKPNCASSQNGRGGMFFVVEDAALFHSVSDLLTGDSAPAK